MWRPSGLQRLLVTEGQIEKFGGALLLCRHLQILHLQLMNPQLDSGQ